MAQLSYSTGNHEAEMCIHGLHCY